MRLIKLVKNVGKIINEREIKEIEIKEIEIRSLCMDSRLATEGCLFFCLTGGTVDGHAFVEQAIKKGAVAVVTQKRLPLTVAQIIVEDSRVALAKMSAAFYGNPQENLSIIGITGTNGKTTTSYMLQSILENAGKKVGVIGTLGIVTKGSAMSSSLTTPDPISLYKTLAEMLLCGIEYVVMEVSAHALYYHKICGITFSACIFTNCTQDHLDFFQTMQAYQDAKLQLFDERICPVAIVNGDDKVGREIGKMRKTLPTIYYGLQTPTDAFAVITNESLRQTDCLLNINDKLCRVTLALLGEHNVYNALGASTCAMALGVNVHQIAKGLCALQSVKGRLQRVKSYKKAEIFVDFAHTPDGLEKSLKTLKKHCKGRLICVFGCGGNRDVTKRPIMGETVAKLCNFAVLTSDNPRYEDPLDILSQIEKGYRRFSMQYVIVPLREEALRYAVDYLKEGDVLLIAGKGGETQQEIMGIKYPFDDNDIIEKIIKEKQMG